MANKDRKLGIDVLGALPWGKHLCYFYNTKKDLVDVLVPYFKAGLENNEFCIWITSETLSKKEAEEAMGKAIPDFSQYLANEQIEIIPHTDWYLKGDIFNGKRVLNACNDKLERAMASGYDGVRATGDTAWLERKDWNKYIAYEGEINHTIGKYHTLVICTYPLHKHGTSQATNVMSNHQFSLIKHKGGLALIGGSRYRQMEDTIQESERRFHIASQITSDMVYERDLQTGIATFYGDIDGHLGYNPGEYPRTMEGWREHVHPEDLARIECQSLDQLEPDVPLGIEYRMRKKDGTYMTWWDRVMVIRDEETGKPLKFIGAATDITERERAEEKEQAIINTAIDGFWTIDINGKFLEVNNSYCQMIGYTREELLKMSISDVEALERPEDIATHINKIILRGSDRFKTQHRCKDGKIIDIEINTIYHNVGKGRLFVFIHDLTVHKHAAESQIMLSRVKSGRHLTELQERFVREGSEELEDQEIIELLLSLVLPAQKAKRLAKACMEQFKNLSDFLAAPPRELQRIGITPACMLCIKLLHELPAKVLKQRIVARSIYKSSREVFDYLYYSMRDLKKEVFKVIYLNNRSQIIDTADLFEGTADNIPIRPREIIESTLTQGATALIFVHNHPTGDPTPSRSDKQLTRDLVFVGNILQIKVLDHIIIGADSYFSFTDDGLTQKYQDSFLNLKIKGVLSSRPLYQIYRRLPKGLHHQHLSKLFTEYQLSFPDREDISSSPVRR